MGPSPPPIIPAYLPPMQGIDGLDANYLNCVMLSARLGALRARREGRPACRRICRCAGRYRGGEGEGAAAATRGGPCVLAALGEPALVAVAFVSSCCCLRI